MPEKKSKKKAVLKTSPDKEQAMKNSDFLKLKPTERLRVHEELRRRIWGKLYNNLSLKGMKVVKRSRHELF